MHFLNHAKATLGLPYSTNRLVLYFLLFWDVVWCLTIITIINSRWAVRRKKTHTHAGKFLGWSHVHDPRLLVISTWKIRLPLSKGHNFFSSKQNILWQRSKLWLIIYHNLLKMFFVYDLYYLWVKWFLILGAQQELLRSLSKQSLSNQRNARLFDVEA